MLRRRGLRRDVGPIVSVRPRRSARARAALRQSSGALAVDMESALARPGGGGPAARRAARVLDTPARSSEPLRGRARAARATAALRRRRGVLADWAASDRPARAACWPRREPPARESSGRSRSVERALDRYGPPVYMRKQIVHNRHVVAELERRGAVCVDELEEVPDGATVVFSAHGVSPQVRERGPSASR